MADPHNSGEPQPPAANGESVENQDQSRREFIKKLTYVTPVLTTYLLDETAFAKDDDDKDKDKDDDDDDDDRDRGRGRGRRRTSPHPGRGRGRG